MNHLFRRRVLAISTFVLLALLCGCMQVEQVEEEKMTGKETIFEISPKTITPQDGRIESFFLHTIGNTEFQDGSIYVSIDPYDPQDRIMQIRIGDNASIFQEKGYVLMVDSIGETPWDNVAYTIAVDEALLIDLTDIVSQSDLYTFSGKTSWTEGLPLSAGMSMLRVTYVSGNNLSYSENGNISRVAQDLSERVRPLLIKVLEENQLSFLPLLNVYHSLPTPTDWIEEISLSRSHETAINTFSFHVNFSPSGSTLTGDCQDNEGVYHCENVTLEEEEAQDILSILREAKFYYQPSEEADPEESYGSALHVKSRAGEDIQAVQHISTDLEAKFNLEEYLSYLTQKYSESQPAH